MAPEAPAGLCFQNVVPLPDQNGYSCLQEGGLLYDEPSRHPCVGKMRHAHRKGVRWWPNSCLKGRDVLSESSPRYLRLWRPLGGRHSRPLSQRKLGRAAPSAGSTDSTSKMQGLRVTSSLMDPRHATSSKRAGARPEPLQVGRRVSLGVAAS